MCPPLPSTGTTTPQPSIRADRISLNVTWGYHNITVVCGTGGGNALNQFNYSLEMYVDYDGVVFVADSYNHRVIHTCYRRCFNSIGVFSRWLKVASQGETIISNISCAGMALNEEGSLYIFGEHQVIHWPENKLVAGVDLP